MDIYGLFLFQFIAHVAADFIFQTDEWSKDKKKNGFSSRKLYWHVLIVFAFSWSLSFQWNFFLFSLIISLLHFIIDGLKFIISDLKIRKIKPFKNYIFFIDQIVHIIIIALIVIIFNSLLDINTVVAIPIANHHLLVITGYLLCFKPSNVFIREVFTIYDIKMETNADNDLPNAGRLIGNIERILTLTLLLMGQYEAVGFLIAAKSILRYEGVKTAKTEYVLIGSLLSFGIAIIIGITILNLPI